MWVAVAFCLFFVGFGGGFFFLVGCGFFFYISYSSYYEKNRKLEVGAVCFIQKHIRRDAKY